jgi:hypothetical protein
MLAELIGHLAETDSVLGSRVDKMRWRVQEKMSEDETLLIQLGLKFECQSIPQQPRVRVIRVDDPCD